MIERKAKAQVNKELASFYLTADGAEFDLVLELPGNCCVRATLVPRSGSSKVAEPVPERTINLG